MARKKTTKRAKKQVKSRKRRSIFSYPLVIFLILCAGVFLVAWTLKAGADIFVTARVEAPFVHQPAVITSPTDGAHVGTSPITVKGTCPANAAYVEIFRGDQMAGTSLCDANQNFSLTISLLNGSNSLTAHVFNSTDDEGPVSASISVYYDLPQPHSLSLPSLTTDFKYKGYHTGDTVKWTITLNGSLPPYAISVDWGDGTSDLLSRTQPGTFDVDHVYTQPGDYKNSYTITIRAIDTSNQAAYLQLFVIVTPVHTAPIGNSISPTIGKGLSWLWIAWPIYLVILLMALSYKLGEREELIILRRRGMLRR